LSVSSNFLPRTGAVTVVVLSVKVYSLGTQEAHVLVCPKSKALSGAPSGSLIDFLSDLDEIPNLVIGKVGDASNILPVATLCKSK